MSVSIVRYRDWIFEVDKDLTEELYRKVKVGGAVDCGCGLCRNFLKQKHEIYPQEIIDLFKELGIDLDKEFEVVDYYAGEQYDYFYHWWFHFVGKILLGEDGTKVFGLGSAKNLEPIGNGLEIGFSNQISMSFFGDHKGELIEIDLTAKRP